MKHIIPNRVRDKNGRILKGSKWKVIKFCLYCKKNERRADRKYCSSKCFGLAERGKTSHRKGKKLEEEYGIEKAKIIKAKMSKSNIGRIPYNYCKKMAYRGKKHHWYKDGKCKLGVQIRGILENKIWKRKVLKRDNYTCQECGKQGGDLHVDHIKPFAELIKYYNIQTLFQAQQCKQLWDINNGRTLCISCHKKTLTYPKNLRYATVRTRAIISKRNS